MTDDIRDGSALEATLKETLSDRGLRLVEVTWKRNLEKRSLGLGLKVTGDLVHDDEASATDELEAALREAVGEHALRLVEVTWKRNLEKETLTLGLKVTGDLDEQTVLPLATASAAQ